jgi:hypothetical protein
MSKKSLDEQTNSAFASQEIDWKSTTEFPLSEYKGVDRFGNINQSNCFYGLYNSALYPLAI